LKDSNVISGQVKSSISLYRQKQKFQLLSSQHSKMVTQSYNVTWKINIPLKQILHASLS